jgi:SAM-dependent methyltransferase
MANENELQIRDWNGAVGERWAAEQAETDPLIRPYGEAALRVAGVKSGERVLDVGCGCGDTSLALVYAVGVMGRVVGVDVSAPMLEVARDRANGRENLTFIEADASRAKLTGPFDLLYSRFGVMFFGDPVGAFRNLRTAMKDGGRLAFVCWQMAKDNPWAAIPAKAAREASGLAMAPPDPHAPGPFAFGDFERVKGILEAAGWVDVKAEGFEHPMYLGSSPRSAAEAASRMGPSSRVAREAGPEKLPAIVDAIEAALKPHAAANGSVALPGRTWVVTAKAG